MTAILTLICSDYGGAPKVLGDCGLLLPLGEDMRLAECFLQVAQCNAAQLVEQASRAGQVGTGVF